jgi:uncharacterized protein YjiS (DUF1127 family)
MFTSLAICQPASRFIGASLHRITRYFVQRAAVTHLQRLEDWALYDIGLKRSEIKAAVRGETVRWN